MPCSTLRRTGNTNSLPHGGRLPALFGSVAGAAKVSNLLAGRRCNGGGGWKGTLEAPPWWWWKGTLLAPPWRWRARRTSPRTKKARRLSFDELSCTVNTLKDDLEDDGGDYDNDDYDEDYLPWISDSESDG